MKKLSKKEFIMVSLMLFSFFFGAGNLIFPPMSGKMSGTNMIIVMICFGLTAVVLPILGVIAVSTTKGLDNLARRVSPLFAVIFTVCIYLCIGPFLGIPRAGSLPFEMTIAPYLPEIFPSRIALLLYTIVFFSIVYFLSLNPKKLIDIIGKFLTPALLILIVLLFATSIIKGLPSASNPVGIYGTNPGIQGFLDGYNTMDAVGALNFGFIIYATIASFNIGDEKQVLSVTKKAGIIAGTLLMVVYFMLAIIGARSASLFPESKNGAAILSSVSGYLFGDFGAIIVGLIFTLACITISIGLVTSTSTFFTNLFKEKLSYKVWLRILILLSLCLANFGLDMILKYTSSLITVIYPVAIALIAMSLLNKFIASDKLVYRSTVYIVLIISLVDGFKVLNLKLPVINDLFMNLPLASLNLGWVMPAIISFTMAMVFSKTMKSKKVFAKVAK
ncbi:branched-chain amino acid transport system II carrier protein [Peptoniphilus stercorisuis]|uniref:Branched-chain amino acid transport system carrier protein n=1 Tax=Peptoniphilus stercorisuis TaxID=1436965 RepID=A0ABS4KA01_9FIRM|nr:branched-chain amino acid transport system II carrier protein [Peptoniphilus stercorisuis]MBP2024613.1 LIVCS family branched-chain amino acid:cation transporter [Peptoniphilus stercorisuis]